MVNRTSYSSCEAEIEYKVSTDYEGDEYLDVDVECSIDIGYKKKESYSWSFNFDSDTESHTLYAYDSDSDEMDFSFIWSTYSKVINVRIESASCKINSVYKY